MLVFRQGRFAFGTFTDLTKKLKTIQLEPSRNQKSRLFGDYISNLEEDRKKVLKSLFQLSQSRFSKVSDTTLMNQCGYFHIPKQLLKEYLSKDNDIMNAISDLYGGKRQENSLSVEDVLRQFIWIKGTVGEKSRQLKLIKISELLGRCEDRDQRGMVLSLLTGNLQIGFEKVLMDRIFHQLLPEQKLTTQHIYPCMLTKPLKDFKQVAKFAKNSQISVEYKFDGERVHLQYKKGESLNLFSRNGKSRLEVYADIESKLNSDLLSVESLESCILDGEIICVDSQGKVTPIQVLLNRKGKSRAVMDSQYQQKIMVFDIIEKNGQSLITLPYSERVLKIPSFQNCQILSNVKRKLFHFPQQSQQFKEFFQQSVKNGYQGLILKKIQSQYDISRGRTDWAKLKKGETNEGTTGRSVDVDLILMGAFRGKGKRKGIFGSFLFGILHNGQIYPITKTGTTLTDQMFEEVSDKVKEYIVNEVPPEYIIPQRLPKPDVWIKPHFVVEIFSQEWSRSPVYEFDENQDGGLSLRFPTFIRIRDDKGISESTKGSQILDMTK